KNDIGGNTGRGGGRRRETFFLGFSNCGPALRATWNAKRSHGGQQEIQFHQERTRYWSGANQGEGAVEREARICITAKKLEKSNCNSVRVSCKVRLWQPWAVCGSGLTPL